ncbi:DUF4279 domain-containing protein [Hymenobacter sublimis]|uniref:DUF4279 domain-containing protein n=1 Tax=Hymenobacter sublimis TaxID=2933777 RepID=A0ABY4JDS3_9BACT|nr:DUF4279 domain-containing protein [Hymenobacter sublimis]UPL50980.1 DUF4279 domain-containing protein [Hymenobacter sublimis]
MRNNHVEVSLEIRDFDDISLEELSAILGMQPSKFYRKGEKTGSSAIKSPINRWLVHAYTDQKSLPDFEEQMDTLLAIVTARQEAFIALCHRYTCEIKCAVNIYFRNGESIPSVHLESRHRDLLHLLRAEFDVDIYCFSKHPPRLRG